MAWCLIKSEEAKFREALVSKKLDPFKLAEMSSEERRAEFSKYVSEENATNINSLFESKLLLKNQLQGFKTWAEKTLNLKPAAKRDLLTKIDRLSEIGVLQPGDQKSFMEDLAKSRLGLGITFEEAQKINLLSEERVKAQETWKEKVQTNAEWQSDPQKTRKQWMNDKTRLDYGLKQVAMENYVNDLKLEAQSKRVSIKDRPVRAVSDVIKDTPSFLNDLFKSIGASLDNSFFGRQGIKNLYGDPAQKRIWTRNFVKSFGDLASGLRRGNSEFSAMDIIKADVYSRPNAVNGKYKAGGYGLDVLSEEAFPTSLPEKIPGLGRLFRASETAYNGGALRMRADLADVFISRMDAQGINTLDPKQARPVGELVGDLTGRGNLGAASSIGKQLNFVMWSAKFLKSNIDTLISPVSYALSKAGVIDEGTAGKQFARKTAAVNMVSIAAHVGGLMLIAKMLDPNSVDEDPRSTNFGKIKINGVWTDVTGGMRSVATVAARLVPTRHDGEWGFWSQSSNGKWTNLAAGKFGQQDGVDVLMDSLFLNKLAPVGSIMRDMWRGEMFGGDPFDIKKSIVNSVIPFSLQSVNNVKDKSFATIFGVAASEFFGLGTTNNDYKSNWNKKDNKTMNSFKEQVGAEKFNQANDDYNRAYNIWKEQVAKDSRYQSLSPEARDTVDSNAQDAIQEKILKEYGYKKPPKTFDTLQQLQEKQKVKDLKPTTSLIQKTNDVLSQISLIPEVQAADGERMVKSMKLLENDRVEIVYSNGDYKNTSLDKFIDSNNGLGRILNDVGTALNLPELKLSENAGYLNRDEKIAEFNKRLDELQKLSGKPQPEVKAAATEATPQEAKVVAQKVASVAPPEGEKGAKKNVPLIQEELQKSGINTPEVLAYALATTQHETAGTFQPVNEGDFNDKKYGYEPGFTGKSEARKRGYDGGENYYGRGFIQLTGKGNYKRYGDLIGVDLVAHPELANDPVNAAKILALYFDNRGVADLIKEGKITEARRAINPDNKGRMIKQTYEKYLEALKQ